jgi:hypothetical protein
LADIHAAFDEFEAAASAGSSKPPYRVVLCLELRFISQLKLICEDAFFGMLIHSPGKALVDPETGIQRTGAAKAKSRGRQAAAAIK